MQLVIARVCNFLHVEEVLGMCTVALVCFLRNFFQSLDNDKVHKYLLWTYTLLSNTISGTLDCLDQYQEQLCPSPSPLSCSICRYLLLPCSQLCEVICVVGSDDTSVRCKV